MTLAVGVDLGGTHARAALVDVDKGAVVGAETKAKVLDKQPDRVAELVADVVSQVDPSRERVGVGIGFAGMLRGWTGVVSNAPNFGWREVPFRDILQTALERRSGRSEKIELYNDLNSIAYGEAMYGGARGERDVLCVYIGTGIGSGLIVDGKLYVGANHLAGEIGHTRVVQNGRQCGCGQRGCIEAYASGKNIQARAREELKTQKSRALEIAGGLDQVHAGHLDQAASEGDDYATALWDEISEKLGLVLAAAVTLLNPTRLVLGGGMWQGAPELRRRTSLIIQDAINRPAAENFAMVETALGDSAGFLGGAALIAHKQ